jgi:hypothetical protein
MRSDFWKKHYLAVLAAAIILAALILRLGFASMAEHPGHGDHAFYYTVAENLADGKGFQIDYIWHYLSHPRTITHSSNDYWMPLTSMIISVSLHIFSSRSMFVALLPSVLAGLLVAVVAFLLGKEYSGSRFIAFWSATLALAAPPLFIASVKTDPSIFYALFASSSLLFMILGRRNPWLFLLSGACAGLAHMTRQDGLLLVLTLVGAILVSPQRRRAKAAYIALGLLVFFIVVSPLLVANYAEFGAPYPPGPSKTVFLTEYEDIYAFSKTLSFQSYLDWGLRNIVFSKLQASVRNVETLHDFLGSFLGIFAIVAVFELIASPRRRHGWGTCLPPLLFLLLLSVFYSLIATFPSRHGGFYRSGMAVLPFLLVIAVDAVQRNVPSRLVVTVSLGVVCAIFLGASITDARASLQRDAETGRELAAVKEVVRSDARKEGREDVVIMTRIPWEVYHSTRYKTVQIPNENLEIILDVAAEYEADYLLLPARRVSLREIYTGDMLDPRFQFVARIPDSNLKLYRLELQR